MTAAVAAAAALVMFPVMGTRCVGIAGQLALRQSLCRRVGAASYAGIEPDASCRQRLLCAAADAAADQRIHMQRAEHPRECAVSAARCIHHLGGYDLSVRSFIKLELLGVTEMLKI